jgi:peptide/nickel transport system permease protein
VRTLQLIAIRVAAAVPTILLSTIVVFSLQRVIPGDPAVVAAGENATPELIGQLHHQMGLDQPIIVQYGIWLQNVAHGDFGRSLHAPQPVITLIQQRLPPSILIWIGALVVALLVGLPTGIWAATARGRLVDTVVTSAASVGIAVPSFWLGMMLVFGFSLRLGWLPATGAVPFTTSPLEAIQSAVLPSIALGVVGAAELCRQARSSMIEVLSSDYIRTDRARGLLNRTIIWGHALKNAGLPIATVFGLLVARVISGSVIVESVFAVPGIGALMVDSTNTRDYTIVQGIVLILVVLVLAVNLVIDLLYRLLDPRLRLM